MHANIYWSLRIKYYSSTNLRFFKNNIMQFIRCSIDIDVFKKCVLFNGLRRRYESRLQCTLRFNILFDVLNAINEPILVKVINWNLTKLKSLSLSSHNPHLFYLTLFCLPWMQIHIMSWFWITSLQDEIRMLRSRKLNFMKNIQILIKVYNFPNFSFLTYLHMPSRGSILL